MKTMRFILAFWLLCWPAFAHDLDVRLNEIMFDPAISEYEDEFVELVNIGVEPVDLTGWTISDGTGVDALVDIGGGFILQPAQYALILDPSYQDTVYTIPDEALLLNIGDTSFGSSGLSNSNPETIILINAAGDTIDQYQYSIGNTPGHSDEKRNRYGDNSPENWGNSLFLHGTPGYRNSIAEVEFNLGLADQDLSLAPIHPQPDETIEVTVLVHNWGTLAGEGTVQLGIDRNYNDLIDNDETIATQPISPPIAPGDSAGYVLFLENTPLGIHRFLVELLQEGDEDLTNNRAAQNMVIGHNPLTINEIYYNPVTADNEVEWIELYNRSEWPINLKGMSIEDSNANPKVISAENRLIQPQAFFILAADSDDFIIIYPEVTALVVEPEDWPSLNNPGDDIVLRIDTGVAADSVSYRDDWGGGPGFSLERKLIDQASNEPANWGTCADETGSTPGAANSLVPPEIDLGFLGFSFFPEQPAVGQPVAISAWIVNAGQAAVMAAHVDFYADQNGNGLPDGSEPSWTGALDIPLAPGDSAEITVVWSDPPHCVARIQAEIDLPSDENIGNNFGFVAIPIGLGQVAINEIMYNPNTADNQPEWIEIVNLTGYPLDLDHWTLEDATGNPRLITAQPVVIEAGALAILTADDVQMNDAYPGLNGTVIKPAAWPSLNNTGDIIQLRVPTGQSLEMVEYSSSWGGAPGVSLERIDAAADGNDPENWRTCTDPAGGTPGARNSVSPKDIDLSITALVFLPEHPAEGESFRAEVMVHNVGLTAVDSFRIDFYLGGFDLVSSQPVTQGLAPGDSIGIESSAIMSLTEFVIVRAEVVFESDENPANNAIRGELIIGDFHPVVINEIYHLPIAENGDVEWIECYTMMPGVDLQNWAIMDATGNPKVITGQETSLDEGIFFILAHNFEEFTLRYPGVNALVLQPESWPSLNNTGDDLTLQTSSGLTVDNVNYNSVWGGTAGISLERIEPGSPSNAETNWGSCVAASGSTPGDKNSIAIRDFDLMLSLLTVAPANPDPEESVSLFAYVRNVGLNSVSAYDLRLFNDVNNDGMESAGELLLTIPGSSIDPGVMQPVEGEFSLPEAGQYQLGVRIDSPEDENPANDFQITSLLVGSSTVIVNEVMYDPEGNEPEWIELYNRTDLPIDLKDWSWKDSGETVRLISAEALIIEPKGFLVLTQDELEFANTYPDVPPASFHRPDGGWAALNNSTQSDTTFADEIFLFASRRLQMDRVPYDDDWGGQDGVSLERFYSELPGDDPANWGSSLEVTPAMFNSISPRNFDLAFVETSLGLLTDHFYTGETISLSLTIQNRGLQPNPPFRVIVFDDANGNGLDDFDTIWQESDQSAGLAFLQTLPVSLSVTVAESADALLTVWIDYSDDQIGFNNLLTHPVFIRPAINTTLGFINEIMYSPETDQPEWIEIKIPDLSGELHDDRVDLQGWGISDATSDTGLFEFSEPAWVSFGGFVIVTSDSADFATQYPDVDCLIVETKPSLPSLASADDAVYVYDFRGNMIDGVRYDQSWGGERGLSLERISHQVSSADENNWATCVLPEGATPGAENSIAASASENTETVLTIAPNPFSPDNDGFEDNALITIQVPLNLGTANLYVYDVQGRRVKRILHQHSIGSRTTVVWDGTDEEGTRVRIGQYILYLEMITGDTGQQTTAKARVVVAGRL